MSHTYPLAPDGIFLTVQGEGALLGVPMVFVRLAGCSVGCAGCDTDYSVVSRLTAGEIADRVSRLTHAVDAWVWVTGGEPTDHDLRPLVDALRGIAGLRLALATSGVREVRTRDWDFVSVSPHRATWIQRWGDQLNLVPGLNGLRLADVTGTLAACERSFTHRYVTPLYGSAASLAECLDWLRVHPGWRLGVQAHQLWELP